MSDAMPHAVLLDHLEERMNGRKLLAGVFLTFEFDPGFFELEILPVLLGVPVSHARPVRLVQLEDALRACAGRLAVYYDANRLVRSEAGSARLDVARIPMRVQSGAFHPKTLLLLVENPGTDEEEPRTRSLLVGALSANLTRSGWWENIEACHFEEIAEGESTRLREGLLGLLSDLRRSAPDGVEPGAAAEIRGFLRRTGQRTWRVGGDRLLPHFLGGRESVPDFLERVAGRTLRGSCLEILSPYLDDARESDPLEELIRRFQPAEVRVLLPRGRDGQAACRSELYESVRRLPNVRWGRLPAGGARWTQGHGGDERFVHAKLYRFFTRRPRREICLVGSVNLTRAAHQKGGNWESALLVEVDCPQAPEFWLALEDARPARFEHQEETTPSDTGGTPLMIRYHWGRNAAEAFWDKDAESPVLTLKARDVERGQVGPLPPRRWVGLSPAWAETLAGMLRTETSFMEVSGHGEYPGLLLVQEEGMSHRPSALLQLTVADILRYWALLTPEQRMAFLELRAPAAAGEGAEGAEHLARLQEAAAGETFFDRFAGSFHSFHCLERAVLELLEAGRKEQADYRLFGRKYDSLGTLLARTADDSTLADDVQRYAVFLCARQLCHEVKRKHPEYWRERRAEARALEADLARVDAVRARLAAGGAEMPGFLDWFDEWFLKRAEPLEAAP